MPDCRIIYEFLKSCAAAKAVGCVCSKDQSYRSCGVGKNGVVRVASGFGRSAAGSGKLSRYFRRRKLAVISRSMLRQSVSLATRRPLLRVRAKSRATSRSSEQ